MLGLPRSARVLPASDPRSPVNKANLVQTCGKCHAGANASFVQYQPHANARNRKLNPALYFIRLFMNLLLASVLTFFVIHTILWLIRSRYDQIKKKISRRRKECLTSSKRQKAIRTKASEGTVFHALYAGAEVSSRSAVHHISGTGGTGLPHALQPELSGRAALPAQWADSAQFIFFHKFCAVVLTLAFLIHVKDIFHRVAGQPGKGDLLGIDLDGGQLEGREGSVWAHALVCGTGPKPKFGRYAYWEKFDYWAVFWGMIVIGFSGYAMWFAPFFARFLPGWALNAVLVIHSEEGLLAILFIFSIHFVNTHLRPTAFPWTWWFLPAWRARKSSSTSGRRSIEAGEQGKLETRLGKAPVWLVNFSKAVGFTAILIGLVLLVLTLSAYFSRKRMRHAPGERTPSHSRSG